MKKRIRPLCGDCRFFESDRHGLGFGDCCHRQRSEKYGFPYVDGSRVACCNFKPCQEIEIDPELQAVVDCWPALPDVVRRSIQAMTTNYY